ncbi:MAG: hypothetical protein CM15mP21_7890 [Hyphomicrobiales bacterium]|nr:MAG: hypothetical protein CM15mP21_7890 [Hyphomicrobiales bacterium]
MLVKKPERGKNLLIEHSDMRTRSLTGEDLGGRGFYTHDHADQTHGIDDLRAMVYARRERIKVWMDTATAQTLTKRFGYCFNQIGGSDYPSILEDNRINVPYGEITVTEQEAHSAPSPSGKFTGASTLGFRIGNVAYSSDISDLPEESESALRDLDVWVVDALRRTRTRRIFISKTLKMIEKVKPRRAILTNLHIDMDYETLTGELPENVCPAYDGMEFCESQQLTDICARIKSVALE